MENNITHEDIMNYILSIIDKMETLTLLMELIKTDEETLEYSKSWYIKSRMAIRIRGEAERESSIHLSRKFNFLSKKLNFELGYYYFYETNKIMITKLSNVFFDDIEFNISIGSFYKFEGIEKRGYPLGCYLNARETLTFTHPTLTPYSLVRENINSLPENFDDFREEDATLVALNYS